MFPLILFILFVDDCCGVGGLSLLCKESGLMMRISRCPFKPHHQDDRVRASTAQFNIYIYAEKNIYI